MLEIVGNIWDFYDDKGNWIAIPTNGMVDKDGNAIMGKGLALDVAKRHPSFKTRLGSFLLKYGNVPYIYTGKPIITFPTKNDWRDKSDYSLISKSAIIINYLVTVGHIRAPLYIPHVGCGCGGLEWKHVKVLLEEICSNSIIAVSEM